MKRKRQTRVRMSRLKRKEDYKRRKEKSGKMKTFGAIETGEPFVICKASSQGAEKAGSVFWEAFWLWSKGRYTRVILFSFSACSHSLVSSFIFSLPHLQT